MKSIILHTFLLLVTNYPASAQVYEGFDTGVAKFKAKDYNAVIESFSALLNNPDHDKRFDADLYYYRGQSYFYQNEHAKGLDDLNKSLALNNYHKGRIYWYKARCHDKLGEEREAMANYSQALTEAEGNERLSVEILADRAQYYVRSGHLEEAEYDLSMARELEASLRLSSGIGAKTNSNTTQFLNQSNDGIIATSLNQDNDAKSAYEGEVLKYSDRKKAGIPLTVLGGILFLAGSQMLENRDPEQYSFGDGLLVTGLGAGCLAAGIPLTISGIRGVRKYKKRMNNLSVGFYVDPRSDGISLICRF